MKYPLENVQVAAESVDYFANLSIQGRSQETRVLNNEWKRRAFSSVSQLILQRQEFPLQIHFTHDGLFSLNEIYQQC